MTYKILSPEEVAAKQLEAYNRRDIDTFISCYSNDVVVYAQHDNKLLINGIIEFKKRYQDLFEQNSELHT